MRGKEGRKQEYVERVRLSEKGDFGKVDEKRVE